MSAVNEREASGFNLPFATPAHPTVLKSRELWEMMMAERLAKAVGVVGAGGNPDGGNTHG